MIQTGSSPPIKLLEKIFGSKNARKNSISLSFCQKKRGGGGEAGKIIFHSNSVVETNNLTLGSQEKKIVSQIHLQEKKFLCLRISEKKLSALFG